MATIPSTYEPLEFKEWVHIGLGQVIDFFYSREKNDEGKCLKVQQHEFPVAAGIHLPCNTCPVIQVSISSPNKLEKPRQKLTADRKWLVSIGIRLSV